MIHSGLSCTVHLNDSSTRKIIVSVAIKPFHEHPVDFCHAFKDEFAPGRRISDMLRFSMRQHRYIRESTATPQGSGKTCGSGNIKAGTRTGSKIAVAERGITRHRYSWTRCTLCGSGTMEPITGLDHRECQQRGKREAAPKKRRFRYTWYTR